MALSGREISGIFFDMSQIRLRFIVIALLAAATVTGAEPVWAHGVEEILAEVRAATARYLDIDQARKGRFFPSQRNGAAPRLSLYER